MDKRLKVGDKVICIDNSGFGHRLIVGKEYTVKELFSSGSSRFEEEPTHTYMNERFELVSKLIGWQSP